MIKSLNTIIIALLCSAVSIIVYDYYHAHNVQQLDEYYAKLVAHKDENTSPSSMTRHSVIGKLSFIEPAKNAKDAVVALETIVIKNEGLRKDKYSKSSGSGVLISSNGYIVTNYHVVENADDINVTMEDKREYKAELIGHDRSTDIALLKIEGSELPFLKFGDSADLQVGEWVLAVGNPFQLSSSVTAGIVSAKARSINIFRRPGIESFIQTDAAINPGNSGGALINTVGELVGINTAILTYTGKYEGFSFAIPSNMVHKIITDIREYGAVQRAWMGITILNINERRANALGLEEISGVFIDLVEKDGAAKQAELRYEDVIISINGEKTESKPVFLEILGQYSPGDTVDVEYIRNGTTNTTKVTLRNQLNTTDYIAVRKDKIFTELGFELRDLDSKEKKTNATEGVMVVSIYKGSKIESVNMDPGYIITSINDQPVTSIKQFKKLLENENGLIYLNGIYENYPREWPYKFYK